MTNQINLPCLKKFHSTNSTDQLKFLQAFLPLFNFVKKRKSKIFFFFFKKKRTQNIQIPIGSFTRFPKPPNRNLQTNADAYGFTISKAKTQDPNTQNFSTYTKQSNSKATKTPKSTNLGSSERAIREVKHESVLSSRSRKQIRKVDE